MTMRLSDSHAASLPGRVRALLRQAEGQAGRARLQTLTVVSQMPREQLDAADTRLDALLAAEDRVVAPDAPAPPDPLPVLAGIAAHLDRGALAPPHERTRSRRDGRRDLRPLPLTIRG